MRVIATDRLTLEPQVASHAEEMFRVLSDPAIYEHENEPPPSAEWLRDRFTKLETRRSPDGREAWLNWVVRLPSSELIGFVQATVHADARASIAYVLGSRFWGRGLAREAVRGVISELGGHYRVRDLYAELKATNLRSRRLLEHLGFSAIAPDPAGGPKVAADELLMTRRIEGE
ncbi:MAG TPA: GNAT family N-acetyltransferase [Candidatus Eisenbacteria bacterium]|nr:GNAT family N-acetyltransferase [Candidatus Eisenbacteria bacterium]